MTRSVRRHAVSASGFGLVAVLVLLLSACEAEPPISPAAAEGVGGEQPKPAANTASAANTAPTGNAAPTGNTAPTANTAPAAIKKARGVPAPVPELTFAVNGGEGPSAYQGQPLVLEATLFHPHDVNATAPREPLHLSTGGNVGEKAAGLVQIEVNGKRQIWEFHPYGEVRPQVTLEPDAPIDFAWWLTPEQTSALAPGEYVLAAVLDKAAILNRRITSPSVRIRIESEPATLPVQAKSARFQLQATYELLQGKPEQALARIDELLRLSPGDVDGLEFRGDLLARAGMTEPALDAYERAIDAYRRLRQRPSPSLVEKQAEQLRKWTVEAPRAAAPKNTGPLEVAFLSADVADGKVLESPFPTTVERFSFVWKLSDGVKPGAPEARWIAAEGDREITRTPASPDARAGEFLWSKPVAGFAAGDYRLEVWQADQRLYTEKFTLAVPAAATAAPATEKPPK